MLAAGSRGWPLSADDEWLWRERRVREDVKTKAVLGREAVLLDVFVVVVEIVGLKSLRFRLGGTGDLRLSLDGLVETLGTKVACSGLDDRGDVQTSPCVE